MGKAATHRSGADRLAASDFEFPTLYEWTVEGLVGLVYSTSSLSRDAIGEHADAFEAHVRQRLLVCQPSGVFRETISFSYDLARRPR